MHFQGDASLGLAGEGRFSATVLLFCPCHLTSTCSHRGLGDHTIGGGVQGKPHKWLVGRVRPTPTSPHWWGHWTTPPPFPTSFPVQRGGSAPPPPRHRWVAASRPAETGGVSRGRPRSGGGQPGACGPFTVLCCVNP